MHEFRIKFSGVSVQSLDVHLMKFSAEQIEFLAGGWICVPKSEGGNRQSPKLQFWG